MPPREGNDVGCNRMLAVRGNGMSQLHSRLAGGATQSFHFFLVDLDLPRLLHLVAKARNEKAEKFLLLALQQRVADLIALGGIIGVGGLVILQQRKDHAVRAAGDGTADVSGLHRKGDCSLAAHRSQIRNLTVGQNRVAGLHGGAQFLGGAFQIMLGFGAIGKFLGFLRKQNPRPFVLELFFHAASNLFKCGRGRGLNAEQLKHYDSLRCRRYVWRRLLGRGKYRVHELVRRPQSRQQILAGKKVGSDYRNTLRRGGCIDSLRLRLLQQRFGLLLRHLLSFLLFQDRLDLALHLVERLYVRVLLVVHAYDVKTVKTLDHVADLTLGQRIRGFFKLGRHLTSPNPTQRTSDV